MDNIGPDVQQIIAQEKQRAMVQEMVSKLTSACWDKCITGTPGKRPMKIKGYSCASFFQA